MNSIKVNFSAISSMKNQTIQKMYYYIAVAIIIGGLDFFLISPISFEAYIIIGLFDSLCFSLFGWHLISYRVLTILETVIENTDQEIPKEKRKFDAGVRSRKKL